MCLKGQILKVDHETGRDGGADQVRVGINKVALLVAQAICLQLLSDLLVGLLKITNHLLGILQLFRFDTKLEELEAQQLVMLLCREE